MTVAPRTPVATRTSAPRTPVAARTGARRTPVAALALLAVLSLLALALAGVAAARASASEPCEGCRPHWHLTIAQAPTNLPPGGEGKLIVTASNLGDATAPASPEHPITISDVLPSGLELAQPHIALCKNVSPPAPDICGQEFPSVGALVCNAVTVSCAVTNPIPPYGEVELVVGVKVTAPGGVTEVPDTGKIEGGGIATATMTRPIGIDAAPTAFGISSYEFKPENEDGTPARQGGAHPFQLTTTILTNQTLATYPTGVYAITPDLLRTLEVSLPPGFVGNPSGVPQCPEVLFTTHPSGEVNLCPPESAVGVAIVRVLEPSILKETTVPEPVFNLQPAFGEPARFGFQAVNVPVTLDAAVVGGDRHVQVTTGDTSEAVSIVGAEITIWGSPSDARHDSSRGYGCLEPEGQRKFPCEPLAKRSEQAFLSLPTSCEGRLATSVRAQAWSLGAALLPPLGPAFTDDEPGTVALEHCESLPFSPALAVEPEERSSNTPTGLNVDLHVPQGPTLEPGARAEADLRDVTVKLPAGVQLSPAAADGLTACSQAQIGFEPGSVGPTGQLEFSPGPAECPERTASSPLTSKIGTILVHTPLIDHPLPGSVYLAAQGENPFGSTFAIYLVIDDPESGVRVKLAGEVVPDPVTGQITTTFNGAPQLPFEDLHMHFIGGSRAPLATPRACSSSAYETTASFTPWSSPEPLAQTLPGAQFAITSGPRGTACADPQPFAPTLQAGAGNLQAGAFTPFEVTLGRADTDQALATTAVKLPPGIAGMVSKVTQCPEPQASQGACPASSLIGRAKAVVGLGDTPFTQEGGQVFFTGPYEGAPFGLSITIPAKAGPFDFGTVVTRARIDVDPTTAALTVTSRLPLMLNTTTQNTGVPVQLRRVDITVERPGGEPFQFNPTNCNPLAVTAVLGGDQGATATASVPFQVDGCDKLSFKPGLSAETSSKVSRLNGTSLKINVTSGAGQANIAKTKIAFPPQLPARLIPTLQGACLAAVFEANPANCAARSVIGTAIARTPVLNSPLVGPVYIVSHGNAEFPDAEFVLQGEGVTLVLDGKTNIHKGVTTSTFETVPDAPVSSFQVTLPAGHYSAFTGFGNMCPTMTVSKRVRVTERIHGRRVRVVKTVHKLAIKPLSMPTTLTGQNGDVIKRITPVKVAGCKLPKPKPKPKPKRKAKK